MRRRRKHLEVSTFPFLAVLLCTMGSLILVLLVMDRKAKLAARQKAEAAVVRAAEEAQHNVEERRAAARRKNEEARAAWERQRQGWHDKLLTDESALKEQLRLMALRIVEATDAVRKAKEHLETLRKQVEAKRVHVIEQEQLLKSDRATAAASAAEETEAAKAAKAAVTAAIANVAKLEAQLAELKLARSREGHTYSVVPYRGKHGDDRRPVYVECSARGVIFHPEHKELSIPVQADDVRAEVERHLARRADTVRPAAAQDARPPYCLLLVRPDGIGAYYDLQPVLKGLRIDFGYEFIDADWLLDFPDDDVTPSKTWAGGSDSGPGLAPIAPPPPGTALSGVSPVPPARDSGPPAVFPGPGGNTSMTAAPGTTGPMNDGTAHSPAYYGVPAADGGLEGPGNGGIRGFQGFPGGTAARGPGGAGTGDGTFASGSAPGSGDPQRNFLGISVPHGIRGGSDVDGTGLTSGVPGERGLVALGPGGIRNGGQGFCHRLRNSRHAGFIVEATIKTAVLRNGPTWQFQARRSGIATPGMTAQGTANGTWQSANGGQPGQSRWRKRQWQEGSTSPGTQAFGSPRQGTANGTWQPTNGGQPGQAPNGNVDGRGPMASGAQASGSPGQGTANGTWQPTNGGQPGQAPNGNANGSGSTMPGIQAPGSSGQAAVNGGQPGQAPSGTTNGSGLTTPGAQAPGTPGQPAANGTSGQRPDGQSPPVSPGTGNASQGVPPGSPDEAQGAGSKPSTIPMLPPLGPSGTGQAQAPSGKPDVMSRLPLPTDRFRIEPKPDSNREAPIRRPSRFNDRDWIIYVECQADRAILYPARTEFSLAALTAPPETNTLLATVQKMIERRQSLVAPGDVPYRPEVRFLIRPNSLRTFHMTYPALDGLAVPKTRQNLAAEDDVRNVMQ